MSRQEMLSEIARLQGEIRACQIAREERERMVGYLIYSPCHYCSSRTDSINHLRAGLKKE